MARVLIGNFGAVLRLGLREVLCSSGHVVAEERSSDDLLERLLSALPDVVVLDLDAEDYAGLAHQIVTEYPAVKVIACSSRRSAMKVYPPFHHGESYDCVLDPTHLLEAVQYPARPAGDVDGTP